MKNRSRIWWHNSDPTKRYWCRQQIVTILLNRTAYRYYMFWFWRYQSQVPDGPSCSYFRSQLALLQWAWQITTRSTSTSRCRCTWSSGPAPSWPTWSWESCFLVSSGPFESEDTGSSPRDPETFLLKQSCWGLEPDPKWTEECQRPRTWHWEYTENIERNWWKAP